MDDPAGERYLRLLVERLLAGGASEVEGPSMVDSAGAALVAVGALDAGTVEQIRGDLALALALRRPAPDAMQLASAVPPAPGGAGGDGDPGGAASPRTVATGENRFETPDGLLVVESISFGSDGATIVEVLDAGHGPVDPGAGRRRRTALSPNDPLGPAVGRGPRHQRWRSEIGVGEHRSPRPAPHSAAPGVPPRTRPVGTGREQLRITDDRGTEYRRGPGESGAEPPEWRWVGSLEPVPGPATTWLEVALGASSPVRLMVSPPAGVARGRPTGRSPGASWLLGALQDAVALSLRREISPVTTTEAVGAGAAALLALGRLEPTEPLLRQLALLEAYPNGAAELDAGLASPLAAGLKPPLAPPGPASALPSSPLPSSPLPAAPLPAAPNPARPGAPQSAARQSAARPAAVPIACVVDLGRRAARLDVATRRHGRLRLSGWFSPWPPGPGPDDTSGWHITGFDDRHNHYVATVAARLGGAAGADVVWELWPALDPAARSLRLRIASPELEAAVEVVVE